MHLLLTHGTALTSIEAHLIEAAEILIFVLSDLTGLAALRLYVISLIVPQ